MSSKNITIADALKQCGTQADIARELSISGAAVSQWSASGIPSKHFPALIKLSNGELDFTKLYALNAQAKPQKEAA